MQMRNIIDEHLSYYSYNKYSNASGSEHFVVLSIRSIQFIAITAETSLISTDLQLRMSGHQVTSSAQPRCFLSRS